MVSYLVQLLVGHNTSRYRTQNAWNKEGWKNIEKLMNERFGENLNITKIKQKEQDLKKEFKTIYDVLKLSGFGWDNINKRIVVPDEVWEKLSASQKKMNDKSYHFYEDLFELYDGHFADGKGCHGKDYYANKAQNFSQVYMHNVHTYSPPPTIPAPGEYMKMFDIEEEIEENNLSYTNILSSQVPSSLLSQQPRTSNQVPQSSSQVPQSSSQTPKYGMDALLVIKRSCVKRQKVKENSQLEDFHAKYLELKREEIDRFAVIEEKKLDNTFNMNKCIGTLEKMESLTMDEKLKAVKVLTPSKKHREIFLSYSDEVLREVWLK